MGTEEFGHGKIKSYRKFSIRVNVSENVCVCVVGWTQGDTYVQCTHIENVSVRDLLVRVRAFMSFDPASNKSVLGA